MRHAEQVTFGGSGLDRADEIRARPEALAAAAADAAARTVLLWRGKPLFDAAGGLARLEATHPVLAEAGPPILLGREDGAARFARDLPGWQPESGELDAVGGFVDRSEQEHPLLPGGRFAELRQVMAGLGRRDAELAATARAVLNWHESHGHCARCGAASEIACGGWQRRCPACGATHFPRTDPVVIMLVTRGNRTLLGRSPGWPEGMYSCLAGFVEPGESVEAAVRREVREEAGIEIGAVRYLASQPWPFPNSLMIGCLGEARSETIRRDPAELEDARWVSREELVAALAGGDPGLRPARPGSIAHFLLRNWLADRLD
ncbi:NAD(+) diphosphatase [Roseivivax sp. CAU 1761]